MKTALIAASIAVLPAMFSFTPGVGQAPESQGRPQIAYVSGQRILAESPDARNSFARLPALQKERATALRAKQQALEATRQKLVQAADGPTRAQLQQQELEQRTDLERASLLAQTDLQALQRQLDADLKGKVSAVVEELVKGQNIQVVLNDTTVIWAAPGADLTAAVIERLNTQPAPATPKP